MKLLICEDEEILITAMTFRLEKLGFKVSHARDIQSSKDSIDKLQPDMLLIDLDMDGGKGLSIVEYANRSVPILILAQPEPESDITEALESGANDFITKPFKPSELLLRAGLVADLKNKS
jgi:DNA-binding response OmpR family regulator